MQTTTARTRWLISADLPAVMELPALQDWTDHTFTEMMRANNVIGCVTVEGEKITGFAVYSLTPDYVVILNMGAKTQTAADTLMIYLKLRLNTVTVGGDEIHREAVRIAVEEDDDSTLLFLQSHGFRAVKTEKRGLLFDHVAAILMEFRP